MNSNKIKRNNTDEKYFIIPNEIISATTDLRDLLPVYIWILKRRGFYDDEAYVTIQNTIEATGRKGANSARSGGTAHLKVIACLEWLQAHDYIKGDKLDFGHYNLTYTMQLKLNPSKLEPKNQFTVINANSVSIIAEIARSKNVRFYYLLHVYCYIAEHIYSNKRGAPSIAWRPEVFRTSVHSLQGVLDMSSITVNKALVALVDGKMLDRHICKVTRTADEGVYRQNKTIYALHDSENQFNKQIAAALKADKTNKRKGVFDENNQIAS